MADKTMTSWKTNAKDSLKSYLCTALLACGLLGESLAMADTKTPVVVELFTSQGCSSCPPADYILSKLAKRENIIALSFHVDYWDYIGWKDTFAQPKFTNRQKWYAGVLSADHLYTPQIVISGQNHLVGSRGMDIMDLIEDRVKSNAPDGNITLKRKDNTLFIAASSLGYDGDFFVELIRYMPQRTVAILRGENAGASATYSNIVSETKTLAKWRGVSNLTLQENITGDEPSVVLIQSVKTGQIVAAAQIR